MKLENLLAGKRNCACGKNHSCPIDRVIIGKNACESLPEITQAYSHILVVADRNTYAVGGAAVAEQLKEKADGTLIYERNGVLVPDEIAIAELKDRIRPQTDLILGIGSGVINDLCKYVSFEAGLPYYIVATAPSMDGYASKGAALILGGMKVTLNAAVPKAILADVNWLKDAPFDMIQAGYGDIIGKYSCLNDWKLSHLVTGEYLCDFVWNATVEAVKKTVALADGLSARSPEAVGALMEALVSVGILMAYVGNSRPASGSEHHLAHYFEIVGIVRGEDYFPHGIDVCYGAVETAKLRERLLNLTDIHSFRTHFDRTHYEKEIRRIYGSVAEEVLALQNKLGWYGQDRVAIYRERWQEICEVLAEAPTPADMRVLVERVGLSCEAFTAFYGKDKIQDGISYAKDLKDRYSVLWMYDDLFRN